MLSLKCFIGSSVLATAALLSITPAAAEDWSGFYLGVHGGGAWSPSSYDHVETLGVGGSEDNREFFSTDGSSVAGGFQADRVPQRGVASALAVPSGQSRERVSLPLAG